VKRHVYYGLFQSASTIKFKLSMLV